MRRFKKALKILLVFVVAFTLFVGFRLAFRPEIPSPDALRPEKSREADPPIPTPTSSELYTVSILPDPSSSLNPSPSPTPTNMPIYPQSGTYWYKTNGWEKAGRVAQTTYTYPTRTKRVITSTPYSYGPQAYGSINHHFGEDTYWSTDLRYYEDRTEITWFKLVGRYGDLTINPDPYMVAEKLPYYNGRQWSGVWDDDDVYGRYSRETKGPFSTVVRGLRINIYVVETTFEYSGEYSGSGFVTDWIDPTRGLVVFTDFTHQGRKGQIDYSSHVQLELESLFPETS